MDTFNVMTFSWDEGRDWFCFDPLVKTSTYAFLHFVPNKESPKKVKIIAYLQGMDNTLIEVHDFLLEIDSIGKYYQEHYIGIVQDGMSQRLYFSTFNPENNAPLKKVCIGVEVLKIKDGNDEDGGNYLRPTKPKLPVLFKF